MVNIGDSKIIKTKIINEATMNDSMVKPNLIIEDDPVNTAKNPKERCPFCSMDLEAGQKVYTSRMGLLSVDGWSQGTGLVSFCWDCAKANFDVNNMKLKVNPLFLTFIELRKQGFKLKKISNLMGVKYNTITNWDFKYKQRKSKFLKTGKTVEDFEMEFPSFQDFEMLIDVCNDAIKVANSINEKEKGSFEPNKESKEI